MRDRKVFWVALMDVEHPHGIILHRNAELAQVVFAEMGEMVGGYCGVYQGLMSIDGCDGMEKAQRLEKP